MSSSEQPEKLDLRSHDIAADKQAALRAAFPEAFTEGGKVDFDRLKLALGEAVDAGKERYGMNWPGKAECFRTIQQPSMATLVPAKEESVEWDTTENLIIEGDNLEVLKLLQKSYLGKVKMIYIDPPYNTGNDFIYPDNYSESLDTYLRYTGQVDSEGRKYATNTEADGRFHSKWMNMMYPRLFLARNLLCEDGVVFVSIDDTEVSNLRKICDEIFGEDQFIANFKWNRVLKAPSLSGSVRTKYEYVVAYCKNQKMRLFGKASYNTQAPLWHLPNKRQLLVFPARGIQIKESFTKGDYGGTYKVELLDDMIEFEGFNKDAVRINAHSAWSQAKIDRYIEEGFTFEIKKSPTTMYTTLSSEGNYIAPSDLITFEECGVKRNTEASEAMKEMGIPFDYPKPVSLVKYLVDMVTHEDKSAYILDFFAGSGTTAEAVIESNKADNGNRKFILVQLPEAIENKEYPTIAEITKERVRRVIKNLNIEKSGRLNLDGLDTKQDLGFKAFKLKSSNFKAWDADIPKEPAAVARQLEMNVHHLVDGRMQEDILFEILLKSGFPLTTPLKELKLAELTVYSIADGAMLICLEKQLTSEVIKEMAALKPERVVCLDEGFAGNDQLKTNAVQTMKTKGVTSFRTV